MSCRDSRIVAVVAAIALLSVYLAVQHVTHAGIIDDSYIFLRYARNVWSGHGAVFNIGERVEGYTSPVWLLASVAAFALPGEPSTWLPYLSGLSGFAAVLAVAFSSRHLSARARYVGAFFLASNPAFAYWAFTGMDTALFGTCVAGLLLTFAAAVASTRSMIWPGVMLALTIMVRPEGVWLAPCLAGWLLWERRQRGVMIDLITFLLPGMLVAGAHLLWRHAYYGAWLPNTYYAKVGISSAALIGRGFEYLQDAVPAFWPLVVAVAVGVARAGAHTRRVVVPLLVVAAWWLVYPLVVGGDHFALFRFLVPLVVIAAIVCRELSASLLDGATAGDVGLALVLVALVNTSVLVTPQATRAAEEVVIAQTWVTIGRWCSSLPAGSFSTLVMGAIPYYCDREAIDLVGLVDAHIARQGRVFEAAAVGHQKFDTDYVLARRPRYIIFPVLDVGRTLQTVADRQKVPERYWHSLIDLTTNPATLDAYAYKAEQLGDGSWVQYLERR